ncbi:Uma2 family endonuclease [bacterium]|nr:MAG: Uma2 family endonuclease [bacterium]
MPLGVSEEEFLKIAAQAEEIGLRIEIAGDLPVFEFMPSYLHNDDAIRIFETIRPGPRAIAEGCGCHRAFDVIVRFGDGSFRRPDISIFCDRPPRTREAIRLVPTAVIEILSPSSITKDTQLSPSFYLSQGVKDVFVYDSDVQTVNHVRKDARKIFRAPIALETESGCLVAFPSPEPD